MFKRDDAFAIMCSKGDGSITEDSPVIDALFRLGVAERKPRDHALLLSMVREAGARWAQADGEQRDFVISAGKKTASLKELAQQMSLAQFGTWMSEIPGMIDSARHPKAPGATGAALAILIGTLRCVGLGDHALRVLLASSALTWRDDQLAQHRVSAEWA